MKRLIQNYISNPYPAIIKAYIGAAHHFWKNKIPLIKLMAVPLLIYIIFILISYSIPNKYPQSSLVDIIGLWGTIFFIKIIIVVYCILAITVAVIRHSMLNASLKIMQTFKPNKYIGKLFIFGFIALLIVLLTLFSVFYVNNISYHLYPALAILLLGVVLIILFALNVKILFSWISIPLKRGYSLFYSFRTIKDMLFWKLFIGYLGIVVLHFLISSILQHLFHPVFFLAHSPIHIYFKQFFYEIISLGWNFIIILYSLYFILEYYKNIQSSKNT